VDADASMIRGQQGQFVRTASLVFPDASLRHLPDFSRTSDPLEVAADLDRVRARSRDIGQSSYQGLETRACSHARKSSACTGRGPLAAASHRDWTESGERNWGLSTPAGKLPRRRDSPLILRPPFLRSSVFNLRRRRRQPTDRSNRSRRGPRPSRHRA
jgi:hypothetical protein